MNKATEKRMFPQDLIDECRKLYNVRKHIELERAIRDNQVKFILNLLEEGCKFNLDQDEIIKAFRRKKENEVLEYAKAIRARRKLYRKVYLFWVGEDNYQEDAVDEMDDCNESAESVAV